MDDITASIIVACQTDGAVAAVNKLKYSFAQLARQAFEFAKESIQAYSDLQEETQKFGLVFEKMHDQAKRHVKDLVDNFGQSELAARKMMSSTGDLLKGWGFEDKDIVAMSGAVARLGADIASFSNYSGGAENATIALTKAMLGETEMAKMLGVAIKTDTPEFRKLEKQALSTGVTIDKLGKSFKAETASQAKAVAAFATMYQQKGYVLGDFKRNQDSIANSARLFDNRFQDLKTTVGDFLDSFINASGINKGFAGEMKSITDTLNKNKVEWGLQIKTVFIEIEFSLKRVGQVLSPLIDTFGTLFERIKGIGTLMIQTSPLEVLKNAALDFAEYTTPVGWGRLLGAAVNEKRLNKKWGGEEGRILENLRRAGEGDSSRVEDEFFTFADIGNRLNDMAKKFDVKMPSFKPLKFDFDFSNLDKEKKKALEDAEKSFRRRYVDEATPKNSRNEEKKAIASFAPVINADIAKAMNQYRAMAQGAIDANSLEGRGLQSRRLLSASPEEWNKKTATGVSTIVGQLREIGKSVAQKSPVTVRPPEVRAGDTSVTVQSPDGKAPADLSWGQRTADGVSTIVGQLREIGKNVATRNVVRFPMPYQSPAATVPPIPAAIAPHTMSGNADAGGGQTAAWSRILEQLQVLVGQGNENKTNVQAIIRQLYGIANGGLKIATATRKY